MSGENPGQKRKVLASAFIIGTALLMFVPDTMFRKSEGEHLLFVFISIVLFIISLILAENAGWGFRGNKKPLIGDFVRLFLSRYFVGEMTTSLYGLLIFVVFAAILTAWLPDSIENENWVWTVGLAFYFLGTIFLTAWVYPAPKKEKERSNKPVPTKYLVYGLSRPTNWEILEKISPDCRELRRNIPFKKENNEWRALTEEEIKELQESDRGGRPPVLNLVPLYASLYYRRKRLEGVYLLITDDHIAKSEDVKKYLREFFERASSRECLNVGFTVHWWDGGTLEIGNGEERKVEVKFVHVKTGQNVREVFKEILNSEINDIIEQDSEEVAFNITGGTAAMSAAMMLHAVRGDAHAEYMWQGKQYFNHEPVETQEKQYSNGEHKGTLAAVDVDIFDLDVLVREMREYFEREYERKLHEK
ncbi:hypothetical protein [Thermococcus sp. Bubb.Bath]|uniref:hypothetical protein n=1 Tax=Thermococcus sp. Bubb.Bath TaxID=1638242 RepID=UPI00143BEFB2|nr:hypothetical protein [Thermococcus sp. Bubb.Bath]NJF24400.1 hypothetical protein [Thermococcus sp. Bubb.Bath]